jgi:mannose-6-phosphate isomerase-like protein (cupin superfamily)
MNSTKETERELAYEWLGMPIVITKLEVLDSWHKKTLTHHLIDSIYDSEDNQLSDLKTGVRIRTQGKKTNLTAKKFIRRTSNGESIFEERNLKIRGSLHPDFINTKEIDLQLPPLTISKQLEFINRRREYVFTDGLSTAKLINEELIYSDADRTCRDYLLEIEFCNIPSILVKKIRQELESKYVIRQINEGKTDRAKRFLKDLKGQLLIENKRDISIKELSAHGGRGVTKMTFFHQPYNHFSNPDTDLKVLNYSNSNWEFFAYVVLPVGSDVKRHKHIKTDEIYYILGGSAMVEIDGTSQLICPGDCILTRKGSYHSILNVTEDLKFIATEILCND